MRKFHYELIDVFTDKQFGGNQLAVFKDSGNLTTTEMQNITRELQLSEATFVTKTISKEEVEIRIFTPSREVPIAGHPTIGTGYVLARDGILTTKEGENSFIFDELGGKIPINILKQHNKITDIEMIQPIPEFKSIFKDKSVISKLLSIDEEDILDETPMQVLSAGVPFLFVPIRTLQAMRKIEFRTDVWQKEFLDKNQLVDIYAFTQETLEVDFDVHGRMFGPTMGISEDAATGAASGPLGAYLTFYNLVSPLEKDKFTIKIEQGTEINRPSKITVSVGYNNESISYVSITGKSVDVGRGTLFLP